MLSWSQRKRAVPGQPSTWFIRSLDEVLGSEGFAIGILGVRREPGVQVSAEHVHEDLGKHNQISLERPQKPAASSSWSQELIPVFGGYNAGLTPGLGAASCLNHQFQIWQRRAEELKKQLCPPQTQQGNFSLSLMKITGKVWAGHES